MSADVSATVELSLAGPSLIRFMRFTLSVVETLTELPANIHLATVLLLTDSILVSHNPMLVVNPRRPCARSSARFMVLNFFYVCLSCLSVCLSAVGSFFISYNGGQLPSHAMTKTLSTTCS